ncbi:MerR family transcriptional regulator [Sphingosinicella soli]|nr:MerR family transcriptional regulator [Sphingosinicella soli]
MRELERLTGVGRETIRFYIREGLLPEPDRASANSAFYNETHVARLKAIKRLQEERFLPLAIIRTLLDGEDGDRWLHADAFPDLDAMLRARLDPGGAGATLEELAKQTGFTIDELRLAVEEGVLCPDRDGRFGPRDIAVARCLWELNVIGFSVERGFVGGGAMYTQFIQWLVGQEMRLFFEHTAGKIGDDEALAMAERGISTINEMLSLMRTREILRQLEARRRIANDNA